MRISPKHTGSLLLASATCLPALLLFHGCGGGGGGSDLNVGINGSSSFASAITLPNVNNTSNSVCNGRSGDLQLSQVSITVNASNNQIAVGLAAPNVVGFSFTQGGFDPSTRRVNFRGEAIDTNGSRIPVLFDGVLNNTREPNTLSGTLDFTCHRGFVNLVSQSNTGFPTPAPPLPSPIPTTTGGPPVNDNYVNAVPIGGASGSINGSTVGNSGEPGEPNHACVSLDATGQVNSVWYNWTAPSTGQFKFFSSNAENSDPTIAIYTGNSVNALVFAPGAANDDNNESGQSNSLNFCATLNATSGQVYRIAIAAFRGFTGPFTLNWTPGPCTNNRTGRTCDAGSTTSTGTKETPQKVLPR